MVGPVFELVGSGEFEPWTREADRSALSLSQSDGTVLIVLTALAPDGEQVMRDKAEKGVRHFADMGVHAEVANVRGREDAFDLDRVGRVQTAGMVFLSGGHPEYLAATLAGTPFLEEVRAVAMRGSAVGGCSAGVWVMGELVPDSRATDLAAHSWEPGLRLVRGAVLAPHWGSLDNLLDGLEESVESTVPSDWVLVGIEERTAIVGNGRTWEVFGSGEVVVRHGGQERGHPGRQEI